MTKTCSPHTQLKWKQIIFTGGGSGGHVIPALTIIHQIQLQYPNIKISFFGSRQGIENRLLADENQVIYYPIYTGKLRRYLSFQNITDLFRIFWGLIQSLGLLLKFDRKNTLVFATGGFVSVPPVFAAKILGFEIVIHEQTSRAGLANKLNSYCADKIFLSFKDSLKYFPRAKAVLTGHPVREEFLNHKLQFQNFDGIDLNNPDHPILFLTGGGNGSRLLNEWLEGSLEELQKEFIIVHQVGQNFINHYSQLKNENYHPFAFIKSEMPDLMKVAKIIISRAGAGTVAELMALNKRSIFVPLKIAQKNEQFHNAHEAEILMNSILIEEDSLQEKKLTEVIKEFLENSENNSLAPLQKENATQNIIKEIIR